MSDNQKIYLVYECWRAENKAVVHKYNCGYANEGREKHTNKWLWKNHSTNDRWFGQFNTLKNAVDFATLLPNREMKLCQCLKEEKY